MIRKIQITLLMLFGCSVIFIGGYNCSQQTKLPGRISIPIQQPQSQSQSQSQGHRVEDFTQGPAHRVGVSSDPAARAPSQSCHRSQYRDLSEQYGAYTFLRFDSESLRDYRFGIDQNHDITCTRMFLDMNHVSRRSGEKYYKGQLTIAYEDGQSIKLQNYKTGFGADHNRNNRWSKGSRRDCAGSMINSDFHAIFENAETALILEMDVRTKNVVDGVQSIKGSGRIWYKMFRAFTGDTSDVCYRRGTYASHARTPPPKPNQPCWMLPRGPYSCIPWEMTEIKDNQFVSTQENGKRGLEE